MRALTNELQKTPAVLDKSSIQTLSQPIVKVTHWSTRRNDNNEFISPVGFGRASTAKISSRTWVFLNLALPQNIYDYVWPVLANPKHLMDLCRIRNVCDYWQLLARCYMFMPSIYMRCFLLHSSSYVRTTRQLPEW